MELGAFVAALCFAIQSIAMKKINTKGICQNMLITGSIAFIIALILGIINLFTNNSFSGSTVVMGMFFGGIFVITILCYYGAMQEGPLSYTTFFYSASMLIPSLAGMMFWGEAFNWKIGTGIVLFLLAFYLICVPGREHGVRFTMKWGILCMLSWLMNGGCSLLIKVHQMQQNGKESNELLLAGFFSAAVIAFALYFLMKKREEVREDLTFLRQTWPLLAICALGNGCGNILVAVLASRLDSAYLYPTVLGGMLILVTLWSALNLKEQINKSGVMGIAAGIVAIVFLNL